MFLKIVSIVFYASAALFAFGLLLPIAMPLLGISAAILAVASLM